MSEIRERAKEWINSKSDRKTITYEHAIIRDLLAELERAEKMAKPVINGDVTSELTKLSQLVSERDQRIDKLEADNAWRESLNQTLVLTVQDTRQQAARECVEIAEAMHVDEYGNGQCGEIADLIKAHFKLQEAPK